MKKFNYLSLITLLVISMMTTACTDNEEELSPEMDSSQFVLISEHIPDVILEIRYYTYFNFPIATSSIKK